MLTNPTPKIKLEGLYFSITHSSKTFYYQWVAIECIATLFLMSILGFCLTQYMLLKRQTKLKDNKMNYRNWISFELLQRVQHKNP